MQSTHNWTRFERNLKCLSISFCLNPISNDTSNQTLKKLLICLFSLLPNSNPNSNIILTLTQLYFAKNNWPLCWNKTKDKWMRIKEEKKKKKKWKVWFTFIFVSRAVTNMIMVVLKWSERERYLIKLAVG